MRGLGPTMQLLAKARAAVQMPFKYVSTHVTAVIVVGALGGIAVSILMGPIDWLPRPSEAGPLLSAQAAIAALTLAVTVFVLQGVANKPDADDRTYREYVRQSSVKPIFWCSIFAVGGTGSVLLAARLIDKYGLSNLGVLVAAAFLINLILALNLFESALRLSRPDQWRMLRLDINRRDVRSALQNAFRRHRQRAMGPKETVKPERPDTLPEPDEGSADEAIRSLLDDARRAMAERRQADFRRALESIVDLVTYAMDEIERQGIVWSPPGSQPEWPPFRELGSNLPSFRVEVIRQADRQAVSELLWLDARLLSNAIQRQCGELFTVALEGYRRNYRIAAELGHGEVAAMLRDEVWPIASVTMFGMATGEMFPYIEQMIRHQERLLSDALRFNRVADYQGIVAGFAEFLRRMGFRSDVAR